MKKCYLKKEPDNIFYNRYCEGCPGHRTDCGFYVGEDVMEAVRNRVRLPRYRNIPERNEYVNMLHLHGYGG